MIVICKNCGGENDLGVVLCRKCGKRLEFEENILKKNSLSLNGKISKTIKLFTRIIVVVILVLIGYVAFFSLGIPSNVSDNVQEISQEQLNEALNNYRNIELGTPGIYSFSNDQLNFLQSKFFRVEGKTIYLKLMDQNLIELNLYENVNVYKDFKVQVKIKRVYLIEKKTGTNGDGVVLKLSYYNVGGLKFPALTSMYFGEKLSESSQRKLSRIISKISSCYVNKGIVTININ